ncbi:MAG: AraC family transcriptional regulator [Armatimonadota bacterium]|nr:AraC family transcriptional regulator [Armatimonadota bacterium]
MLQAKPPGHFCRHLSNGQTARLCTLFEEIHATDNEPAQYNAGLGYALLSAWATFAAAEELPIGSDVHPAVEHAARLIRDEVDPLSVEQIAARVGLSASRLSRLFGPQIGMGIADFRNAQRLQRFLRLYGRGQSLSASRAALEAGFGSYPQFHRIFTQAMGYSPAEHRRRNRR